MFITSDAIFHKRQFFPRVRTCPPPAGGNPVQVGYVIQSFHPTPIPRTLQGPRSGISRPLKAVPKTRIEWPLQNGLPRWRSGRVSRHHDNKTDRLPHLLIGGQPVIGNGRRYTRSLHNDVVHFTPNNKLSNAGSAMDVF